MGIVIIAAASVLKVVVSLLHGCRVQYGSRNEPDWGSVEWEINIQIYRKAGIR